MFYVIPTDATCSPVHATSTQIHATFTPVHATCIPVNVTCTPVHVSTCTLVHSTCTPVYATCILVQTSVFTNLTQKLHVWCWPFSQYNNQDLNPLHLFTWNPIIWGTHVLTTHCNMSWLSGCYMIARYGYSSVAICSTYLCLGMEGVRKNIETVQFKAKVIKYQLLTFRQRRSTISDLTIQMFLTLN